jgi:hypothetical protein
MRMVQVWIGLLPDAAPGLDGEGGLCMQVEKVVKAVDPEIKAEVAAMLGSDILQSDLKVGEATWQIPVLAVVDEATSHTLDINKIMGAVGSTVGAYRDKHLPLRGKVNVNVVRAVSSGSY